MAFILLSLYCHEVSGQSAVERYGQPIDSLPSVIIFDCAFEPNVQPASVSALGTKMWVPKTFELQEGEGLWLNKDILLKDDQGQPFKVTLAAIHIGEYKADFVSGFFGEFETIAGPETNNLGATVIQRLPQPEDRSGQQWLFLLRGTSFLKIISYDPVDWASLLACLQ